MLRTQVKFLTTLHSIELYKENSEVSYHNFTIRHSTTVGYSPQYTLSTLGLTCSQYEQLQLSSAPWQTVGPYNSCKIQYVINK